MDTVPGNVNISALVNQVTSSQFLSVVALPQLNSVQGEEFRRMLLTEADLLKGLGKDADAVKIRMIGNRINESLDQDDCQKKALEISSPLGEKSPAVGEAEGSKTRELRGLQSLTAPNSVNSVSHHAALERAPASKTSPFSQEKSQSRPRKPSPQPLNFSMKPSSGGQFEVFSSRVRNVKRRKSILTLSKSAVPKEAQPGSGKENSGEGSMRNANAEFRASSSPLSVKDTARTSEKLSTTEFAAGPSTKAMAHVKSPVLSSTHVKTQPTLNSTHSKVEAMKRDANAIIMDAQGNEEVADMKRSEEQDKFSNDKDIEGSQSSTGSANPPHQGSYLVNFKRMDGRCRVEGMPLIDPTELSSTDGSYQMLGRFVPMRIQYVLFEDSQSLPQSSTNPPTMEPGSLLAAEEVKSMIRGESLHCPFNITPESVSKSCKFRTLALSLCNLWIVITSLWALYSAWQHSDEMLTSLGARVEDLKEIGLWVLDMLFGFIGSVVQAYDEWREGN